MIKDNSNLVQIIKYKDEDYDTIKAQHRAVKIKCRHLVRRNLVLQNMLKEKGVSE